MARTSVLVGIGLAAVVALPVGALEPATSVTTSIEQSPLGPDVTRPQTLAKKRTSKSKRKADEKKAADKKAANKKAADKKAADKKAADKKAADKKAADKKAADKNKTGEKKADKAPDETLGDRPDPEESEADDVADEWLGPTPFFHSFRRAAGFHGNLGVSTLFMGQQNGAATGYAKVFARLDAKIGESGFGFHVDMDVRASAFGTFSLFEPRNQAYMNDAGESIENRNALGEDADTTYYGNAVGNYPGAYYRQPGTLVTGRTNDYLRVDSLNLTYDAESFGGTLGRMFIVGAAQAQVDGVEGHFVLDGLGTIGAFGGFKPNPWHQQVVGASSGGYVLDGTTGDYIPVSWGSYAPDPLLSFSGGTQGAYSNEIGLGVPYTQFLSLRFLTAGMYGSLRLSSFFMDAALVADMYTNLELNPVVSTALDNAGIQPDFIDRVWFHTSGGVRILDGLTLSWRGTIDIAGARVMTPRDLFVDATWRDLGPVTLSATYYKVNTFATASSFFRFFRPLESPTYAADFANNDPNGTDIDFTQPGVINALAASGLNNTSLFLVDRDRLRSEIALEIVGSMQVYAQAQLERRADAVYTYQDIGGAYAAFGANLGQIGNTLSDPTSLCFVEAQQTPTDVADIPLAYQGQAGINPTVPVSQDLCKWGGSVGIRDPFLSNIGSFDLRLTHMNGYFQSTTRVAGHIGAGLFGAVWMQAGGSLELNTNERTFGLVDTAPVLGDDGGTRAFFPTQTNVYSVDTSVTWNVFWGFFVEASYAGFIEDLPYQGVRELANTPYTGEKYQVVHSLSGRALWRF